MKDYYKILQVHYEAEADVINVAYRRLIRKYHPDVLPQEFRDDPGTIQRALDINEAYEILSDPVKRAEYDQMRNGEVAKKNAKTQNNSVDKSQSQAYERAYLFVRCGQTKEVFKALIVRKQKSKEPFILIGFEPIPDYPTPEKNTILGKISQRFHKKPIRSLAKTDTSLNIDSLSDEDIFERLNNPPGITMGDIMWGQHTCPACAGSIQNENGTKATWIGCSNCGRIRCAGGIKDTKLGRFSTCPWCGKTNKITRSVPTGKKDHLQIHGLEVQKEHQQKHKNLPNNKVSPKLPTGKED